MRIMPLMLLLAILVWPAEAQHDESVTVEVVEVPVYVWRNGAPVTGLTREHFELLVDGKPQPIDHFDVIDPRAAAPEAVPRYADRRQRRHFLLVFDLAFSGPHQVERGRRAAMQLIERAAPTDSFAVATFTSNRGVEYPSPFGADAAQLRRAINDLRVSRIDHARAGGALAPRSGVLAPRAFSGTGSIQQGPIDMPGTAVQGGRGRGFDIAASFENRPLETELDSAPIKRLSELLLGDFTRAGELLARREGQKHVVVFSAGPPLALGNSYTMELLLHMEKAFQRSNAFLHTVDIAGLRHGFEPGTGGSLHTLARGTGGMYLHNTNDFRRLMKEVDDLHRYAYVLGFTPRVTKKGHRTVEVRVRDVERAMVSYRRGF